MMRNVKFHKPSVFARVDAHYFTDGNRPGTVYWALPHEELDIRGEFHHDGCDTFSMSPGEAKHLTTTPDPELGGRPWKLRHVSLDK